MKYHVTCKEQDERSSITNLKQNLKHDKHKPYTVKDFTTDVWYYFPKFFFEITANIYKLLGLCNKCKAAAYN